MSKEEKADLVAFIKPYPEEVQELALWLRDFVWDLYPKCNELIYDNYNAVAFGWSVTERLGHTFCSVALFPKYVHFGFYWGSQIADPKKLLLGKGNQYRYVIVRNKDEFPKTYIKQLLKEAYANSLAKVKEKDPVVHSLTVVKSIVPIKKRPGLILTRKKKRKKTKSQT